MRKAIVAILFLSVFFGIPCLRAEETITVRADTWMPYNGDPASDRPGYCIELIKAIFEPAGIKIDYQVIPWTQALAEVQANKIDAIIGTSPSECTTCLFPWEAAGPNQNSYYIKKGNPWIFNGLNSLRNKHLGVIEGYFYDDGPLDKYITDIGAPQVQKSAGDNALEHNLKELEAGRLDVIVENDLVIREALRSLGLAPDSVVPVGQAKTQNIFLGFAPGKDRSKTYLNLWDRGIKNLRASGKLKEILARYNVPDWA